jgi:SnoaL-like domain
MSGSEQEYGKAVIERLLEAVNAHDPQSQLALFNEDYRSEQPAHPGRTFSGRAQVRENWSSCSRASLTSGPSSSVSQSLERRSGGERIWRGTKEDGTPLEKRGVTSWRYATTGGPAARSSSPSKPAECSPGARP